MKNIFSIEDLHVYYGPIHVIKGVSLVIKEEGELVSLIGANGAGKTTIMHCISGLLKARQGQIIYNGMDLLKLRTENIITTGLVQVPEGRRIFTRLNVEDNLQMGAYIRTKRSEVKKDIKKIFERFPRLAERRHQAAGTLSGGEQQMLAIARAMMSRPKLLLMDEPSMGLAPLLVKEVFDLIQEMRSEGTTILLVEQNARMALSIADRAYVLETGKIVHEGIASEMLQDERVSEAYLGA
ncbi:MAG: ABC transporter ATP-binding protein [Clostridiaceae bacterium]|nr:ABC transporter ATP-binding protein [Clostridiaceae bacterium]